MSKSFFQTLTEGLSCRVGGNTDILEELEYPVEVRADRYIADNLIWISMPQYAVSMSGELTELLFIVTAPKHHATALELEKRYNKYYNSRLRKALSE